MGMMSDKDKSIAAIIVEKAKQKPQEKIVNNLEADFEDAKNAAFDEFLEAIEQKDKQKLKAAFTAIMDICSEESQYDETEQSVKV